jgi:hypothetical protein
MFRKREQARIDQENLQLAKRIINSKGSISFKNLKLDYKDHKMYVRNMGKYKSRHTPNITRA